MLHANQVMISSHANALYHSYEYCERFAKTKYENFTVGSFLLPRSKRKHIYAIYSYCRIVDDIGDECTRSFPFFADINSVVSWESLDEKSKRLILLEYWESELELCYLDVPNNPVMYALQDTIRLFDIPRDLFCKLIQANKFDQINTRYDTFEDLLKYCDYSANPVGRMFLCLFGHKDRIRQALSDSTCTGLQLVNFWQDIRRDLDKGRIYIPKEDMSHFGYSEPDLFSGLENDAFRNLIEFQIDRTVAYLMEGSQLVNILTGVSKLDVALFTSGGMQIANLIRRSNYKVLKSRPRLSSGGRHLLVFMNTLKYLFDMEQGYRLSK